MKRYLVIGGKPFRCYTGTGTFTGLVEVGKATTVERARALVKANYEACGGLLMIIDLVNGCEVSI